MTVSVIIPTYNRNDLLFGRSLPSVLAQTYRDIEVLIVADGMDEPAMEDLSERLKGEQFDTSFPLKLWNIERPDYPDDQHLRWGMQACAARNFGLDHARGEFVAMLDDDDELLPNTILDLLAAMTDNVDFVYGKSEVVKNGALTGQRYGSWPPGDGALCHGAFVYRRNDFRYREEPNGRTADADMWERMYTGGVRFKLLDEVVHRYHRFFP